MTTEEFDSALSDLETRVDRLRALYENWFRGYEKSEPSVARKEVERRVYQLRKELPRNTALRFRYHQLYQRYTTLATYWQRTARQIEEGTYKLQLTRLKRRNERVRPGQRREGREGEKPEKDEPQSYELDLDESLNVRDLLDDAELDEVARALDAPGPHSEAPPRPAQAGGILARSGGAGTLPRPAPLPTPSAPVATSAPAAPLAKPAAPAAGTFARPGAPAPFGGMPSAGKLPAPPPARPGGPVPASPAAAPGTPPAKLAKPAVTIPQVSARAPEGALRRGTLAGIGRPLPPAPAARGAEPATGVTSGAPRPPLPAARGADPATGVTSGLPRPAAPTAATRGTDPSAGAAVPRPPVPAAPVARPVTPAARAPRAPAPPVSARAPEGALRPPSRPEVRAPGASAPIPGAGTFVGRPPLASPIAGSPAPNEQRMKRIYDEYAAARRRNNEGEIRYEALVSSIQKMLPELSKKHQGRQIDFDVVVKDGRVGLKPKAT